jgi:L-lysine 6-transaminase
VENALKAAMDWKVRRNLAAGRGERGTEILHFERAFHGRSGYTLSLTNTDPRKTDYFAKFPWPRVPAPALDFALAEAERSQDAADRERRIEMEIRDILRRRGEDLPRSSSSRSRGREETTISAANGCTLCAASRMSTMCC